MQLFISFTAENRVDFRLLLRELATTFRIRLNFAKLGQEMRLKFMVDLDLVDVLCAVLSLFIEFPNVSIKMAKNQNLSLKQNELNGLCGRLMCCLTYEDSFL